MSFRQPNIQNYARSAAHQQRLAEEAAARQMIAEAYPDRGLKNRVKRLLKRGGDTSEINASVTVAASADENKYPPLPGL